MPKKVLPCAIWYEAVNCWTDPGECNDDHPTEDSLGFFAKRKEAKEAGRKKGLTKFLTKEEYKEFLNRIGHDGCYIRQHLVVFTGRSRTEAVVVSGKRVELTSARVAREQSVLARARRAGIPARCLDLSVLGSGPVTQIMRGDWSTR